MSRSGAPVVTGLGLVVPTAIGRADFVQAWRDGAVAEAIEEGPRTGGMVVPALKARELFPEHRKMLRRMDRLSKLICMGVGLARDDGLGFGPADGVGMAIGTDLGTLEETWKFVSRLRDKGPALANPMDFPNLVPNAGAGYAGIFMQLTGPSHTFCQHETCGDDAVSWIADGIEAGWMEAGFGGGAEELSDVRMLSVRVVGGLRPGEPEGEGSAAVFLERPDRAASRGAPVLARWLGSRSGSARSARSPLRRPEDPGSVAVELVRATLRDAEVEPSDVGAVLLSHPEDDAMQAAVRAALGRDVPATDHHRRFGRHPADGALRAALGALLLADRSLPVHADGGGCEGSAVLLLSVARGGAVRASVLGQA